jgi:hypothetical protein
MLPQVLHALKPNRPLSCFSLNLNVFQLGRPGEEYNTGARKPDNHNQQGLLGNSQHWIPPDRKRIQCYKQPYGSRGTQQQGNNHLSGADGVFSSWIRKGKPLTEQTSRE